MCLCKGASEKTKEGGASRCFHPGEPECPVCPCTRPQVTLGQKLLPLEFSGVCGPLYKLVEPEEGVVGTPDL